MDAIQLLTLQHRALEGSLKDLLDCPAEQRPALLKEAGDRLAEHLASEEQVFYPAVHVGGTEDVLRESLEEHLSLKRLLADLLPMPGEAPQFEAKLHVLKEQAEHHHKEEEEHLFPKVLKILDLPARHELGLQMIALQQRMSQGEAGESAMELADDTERAAPLE
ncbi:MAG: hemerythrin domain-containing protein [Cytophagales bacterium]|nr:hemerythrin domain-containing protein [Rhizobacter sp.]